MPPNKKISECMKKNVAKVTDIQRLTSQRGTNKYQAFKRLLAPPVLDHKMYIVTLYLCNKGHPMPPNLKN